MRRREFLALLGAVAAWPRVSHAQQPAAPVIGFLGASSADRSKIRLTAFRQGLGDAGFVEGQNVTVEYRCAEDRNERLPALAAELVERKVALIVAGGGAASVLAAKGATTTIPIVVATAADPVALGLTSSLNRPS